MNQKTGLGIGVAALLLVSAGGVARGSTLYTNLNTDLANQYNRFLSYIIEGALTTQYFAQAFSFTPSVSDGLAQVDLALHVAGANDRTVVTLQADNSGFPGAVLETWTVTGLPGAATCCTLQTLVPTVPITLFTGTTYWLVATPGDASTDVGWNVNNTGVTGRRPVQESPGGVFELFGTNDPQGAFDVIGNGTGVPNSAVPEPASVALALAGLLMLAARAARRK